MEILFEGESYFVRHLESEDGDDIQSLCENCSDYFELVTGLPPGPSEGQNLFFSLPPGRDLSDKIFAGIFDRNEKLFGLMDVIRDYPQAGVWHVGLMLLHPEKRGKGLGRDIYKSFEKWARNSGANTIRLGVAEQNEGAVKFWTRAGFDVVEKRKPEKTGNKMSVIIVMTRPIV
ncbi:MAG: GNAT family N-acetyltransferase [Candidatus Eremiobacterota bacterium]